MARAARRAERRPTTAPSYEEVVARVAANLRRVRDDAELTQEQVAEAVGIGVRHLQRLETGEGAASLRLLTDLGRALSVDVREFFAPAISTNPRPPGRPRKRS